MGHQLEHVALLVTKGVKPAPARMRDNDNFMASPVFYGTLGALFDIEDEPGRLQHCLATHRFPQSFNLISRHFFFRSLADLPHISYSPHSVGRLRTAAKGKGCKGAPANCMNRQS